MSTTILLVQSKLMKRDSYKLK